MEEIVSGLWRIPLGFGGVNSYVWRGEEGLTLVDCGYMGDGRRILGELSEAGYSPRDVRHIVITHGDVDHIGSLAELQTATGATVLAHALEVDFIEGKQPRQWRKDALGRMVALGYNLLVNTGLARCEPVQVGRALMDGDRLDGGWQVVHTPGHTPGHISLYHPERRVAIVGDLLSLRFGRLRGPVPAYAVDTRQAAESVRKLAALEPRILCFGHFRPLMDVEPEALYALAARL